MILATQEGVEAVTSQAYEVAPTQCGFEEASNLILVFLSCIQPFALLMKEEYNAVAVNLI